MKTNNEFFRHPNIKGQHTVGQQYRKVKGSLSDKSKQYQTHF